MKSKSRSIGSFAAKTHFSQLLDEVGTGAEFTITKRGRPVARLTSYAPDDSGPARKEALDGLEAIRHSVKGRVNIRQIINEGRKR